MEWQYVTGFCAIVTLLLAIFITLIRFARSCLTVEEHNRICEKRDIVLTAQAAEIKADLKFMDERAAKSRHDIRDDMQSMMLDIAVIKAKLGP